MRLGQVEVQSIAVTDVFSPEMRSLVMGRVGSKDTKPEMIVRKLVHSLGFRYRLHRRDLPGKPDLVFSSRGKVIFVHGCFWHGHACVASARPQSNRSYWNEKLDKNILRDKCNYRALKKLGWSILKVWECETRNPGRLRDKIVRFIEG